MTAIINIFDKDDRLLVSIPLKREWLHQVGQGVPTCGAGVADYFIYIHDDNRVVYGKCVHTMGPESYNQLCMCSLNIFGGQVVNISMRLYA